MIIIFSTLFVTYCTSRTLYHLKGPLPKWCSFLYFIQAYFTFTNWTNRTNGKQCFFLQLLPFALNLTLTGLEQVVSIGLINALYRFNFSGTAAESLNTASSSSVVRNIKYLDAVCVPFLIARVEDKHLKRTHFFPFYPHEKERHRTAEASWN